MTWARCRVEIENVDGKWDFSHAYIVRPCEVFFSPVAKHGPFCSKRKLVDKMNRVVFTECGWARKRPDVFRPPTFKVKPI